MKKIAVLCPYYGALPWYFPLFVNSCALNRDIDFLFFTDQTLHMPVPDNLIVIHMPFASLKQLLDRQLGMETGMGRAYKLCDYRPAFGEIFSDYLTGYDFWGHCDTDILLGRVRAFLTEDVLENYDVIPVRPEFVTGFFTLYRNTPHVNTLYKKSEDYEMIFRSSKYFCFDECCWHHRDLMRGRTVKNYVDAITFVLKRYEQRVYRNMMVVEDMRQLSWDNGVLQVDNRFEILLYHLIHFKRKNPPVIGDMRSAFTQVSITPNNITLSMSKGNAVPSLPKMSTANYAQLEQIETFTGYNRPYTAKFPICGINQ